MEYENKVSYLTDLYVSIEQKIFNLIDANESLEELPVLVQELADIEAALHDLKTLEDSGKEFK